jgi:hypothetical protein
MPNPGSAMEKRARLQQKMMTRSREGSKLKMTGSHEGGNLKIKKGQ